MTPAATEPSQPGDHRDLRAWVASRSNVLTRAAVGDDLHLIFNGFTGALLELDGAERAAIDPWITAAASPLPAELPDALARRLAEGGFLVPPGFDELATLRALRDDRPRGHFSLTIAPTMQCNFRCTYCFEEHRNSRIGPDVEHALQRFIADHVARARQVSVTWFGGEPLLEVDLLERTQRYIDALAASAGVPASRALVTNGYLLTDEVIARLVALGPWRHFQVTVDGTAVVHDGRRLLRGGQGTWQRIVDNTRRALDAGLPVSVRMNVDRRNEANLADALDALIKADVLPRARIYLGQVSDSTDTCAHVEEHMLGRQAFLLQRGLPTTAQLPRPLCNDLCIADNATGYVVGPSGLLFKCWNQVHMGPPEAIGHLTGQDLPEAADNLRRWTAHAPLDKRGCQSCFALPTCMGGCPWESRRLSGDTGSCGDFRFYPQEIIQIAHLGMVERRLAKAPATATE